MTESEFTVGALDIAMNGAYANGVFTVVTEVHDLENVSARLTFTYNAEGMMLLETLQGALASQFDNIQSMILDGLTVDGEVISDSEGPEGD